MVGIQELTLPIVVGTAIIDSINPCAIGVLILLVATLLQMTHDRKKMLFLGTIYIAVVYVTYLLAGLGLIWFQGFLIQQGLSIYLGVFLGLLMIALGIVEIKDFFWYGKGFSLSIPPQYAELIKEKSKDVTVAGAVFLGALVAMVELPCTGGPYLAITAVLAKQFDPAAFIYLVIYNFIFVLPLIIILLLAYSGVAINVMKDWKQSNRKWMRLGAGLLLLGLGVFLMLYYMNYI